MSLLELFKKIKLKKLFQKTTAITLSGLYSIVFLYHPTQSYAQPGILSSGAMPLVSQTLNSNQSSFFMKGVKTFSSEPFKFDFLVENNAVLDHSEKIEKDISKLLKYFMASLAIPNDELWVNLSPDEEDRVISESFSETDMGRDMLTQDYFLKQITSSLTNPEGELGDRFWNNLYARIYDQTGSLDFDLKAFNRVWIVPDQAEVIVTENTAMVGAATFKVLLDRDYQQISQNEMFLDSEMNKAQKIYDDVLKEVIIPVLEDEVNSGKNFIPLRQIFHALILATWFKRSLKQSVFNQAYADKTNVNGIGIEDPLMKEKIYQRYLDAYRQGVYDMIKEEYDPQEQKLVSRQYFSGGVSNLGLNDLQIIPATASSFKLSDFASLIKVETEMASYDPAMVSFTAMKNFIGHLLLVIILATGISFSAQAATYAAGTTGELIVQVEEGDNLSNIAYDIKSTYRSVDSLGYSHSVYQGNMYKSGGAFDQVSANVSEPKGLIQKDQTFVVEGLPQTVVEALVDDDPTENENVIQVDTSSENQNETGKGIESKKDSISITFVEGLNDFTTTSTLSEKTNIQPVEKIETESQTSGAFLNRFSSKQIWAFVLSTLGVLSLVLIGLKHKAKSKKKLLKSTVATQMKKTSPAVEKTETIPAIIIPTVQVDNRSEEIEQIRNEGSSFSFSYQLVPSTDNTDTGFGEKETDSEFGYKIDLNAMRSPVNPVGINEKDNIGFKTHETKLREIKPDQIDFNRTMPVIEDDRVGFGVQERDMETGFQLSLNRRRGDFFQSIADEKNEDRVGFGIQDRDTENAYLLTFDFLSLIHI